MAAKKATAKKKRSKKKTTSRKASAKRATQSRVAKKPSKKKSVRRTKPASRSSGLQQEMRMLQDRADRLQTYTQKEIKEIRARYGALRRRVAEETEEVESKLHTWLKQGEAALRDMGTGFKSAGRTLESSLRKAARRFS